MKFYIAGRITDPDSIKWIQESIAYLESIGHTCTFDWTKGPSLKPYEDHPEESGHFASCSVEAIREADLFILVSHPTGTGMYVEYGVALAEHLRKGLPSLYLTGQHNNCSMFNFHPALKWKTSLAEIMADVEGR